MKKFIIFSFIIAVLAIFKLYLWSNESGPLADFTTVCVYRGSTVRSIANDMKEAGVIDKPWLFEVLARLKKVDRKVKAGEYSFPASVSMLEALNKIARGEVFYRKITILEGYTVKQAIDIINNEEYLTGEITVDVKEGEMLAETYMFSRGDSRNSIVNQAKLALNVVLDAAWENRSDDYLKDKYHVLILASIIEKETSIPEERGLVASVFANRLRIGMRLQTDPTVIYAITKGQDNLGRSLKKADMKIDSPYNTYRYAGLPPTPICNVSRDSIEAALHPEDTKYLYFVANGNGGHNFSKSYKEHEGMVQQWIRKIRSTVSE